MTDSRFGKDGERWLNWLVKTAKDGRLTAEERISIIAAFPAIDNLPRMLWVSEEPSDTMVDAAMTVIDSQYGEHEVREAIRKANLAANQQLYPRVFGCDDDITEFMNDVTGICIASRYEQSCLWDSNRNRDKPREWKSMASGRGWPVGRVEDMPVYLSAFKSKIDDNVIMFIEPTGQMVDYRIVEEWLQKYAPKSARREDGRARQGDAGNFHNVLK